MKLIDRSYILSGNDIKCFVCFTPEMYTTLTFSMFKGLFTLSFTTREKCSSCKHNKLNEMKVSNSQHKFFIDTS
jgi:hypothetical protein